MRQIDPALLTTSYFLFIKSPLPPPPTHNFYRQMLALRGSLERGAPQSPIANSMRKKATTLWVCP